MKGRVITAVLAVIVVLVGVGVNDLEEGRAATEQIPTPVVAGQDSSISSVSVHLHGARAVEAVVDGTGEPIPTSGLWVVADLSYAAHQRATFINSIMLVDSQGRQYEHSPRPRVTLRTAEPDLWQRGEVAFEVPADALGEMVLEIYVESRWLLAPVRFGRAHVQVGPEDVQRQAVELRRIELLPAGQR